MTTLRTRICELLGIEYPVVLAGMSPVSRAELTAAVSEAGGLGILGAAAMSPEEIRQQVREIRERTSKPFGVDILLPNATASVDDLRQPAQGERAAGGLPPEYLDWQRQALTQFGLPEPPPPPPRPAGRGSLGGDFAKAQVQAIIDEGVPVFASGLGNPAPFVPALHAAGIKVMALVGNVKNARRVADGGVDIVVAQGTEAGGHTGRIGTMALVPQVVDAVAPVPVVAAGGVADGRGLAAAIALGADGIWCGTAFLATDEAHLEPELKQRVVAATEEDTKITRLYSGKTMRNINNPLIDYWEASGLGALPMGAQGVVVEPIQRAAREAGRIDLIRNAGGQIAGLITRQRPAAEVVREIVETAEAALERLQRLSGEPVGR
jgi:nitronate monooxygenase